MRDERFTLLTCDPGPDIAPYHDRQPVVLGPADWREWLTSGGDVAHLLKPSPAGQIKVEKAV